MAVATVTVHSSTSDRLDSGKELVLFHGLLSQYLYTIEHLLTNRICKMICQVLIKY